MSAAWYRARSRGWWLMALFGFLALELVLRTKLGTIFVVVALWALSHLALEGMAGQSRTRAMERLLLAVYAALVVCAFIFVVFSILNISLRTIDNSWSWFQLP